MVIVRARTPRDGDGAELARGEAARPGDVVAPERNRPRSRMRLGAARNIRVTRGLAGGPALKTQKGPGAEAPGPTAVPDGYSFSTVTRESYSTLHSTKSSMLVVPSPSTPAVMAAGVTPTTLLPVPRVFHWQVRVYVFSTASQP